MQSLRSINKAQNRIKSKCCFSHRMFEFVSISGRSTATTLRPARARHNPPTIASITASIVPCREPRSGRLRKERTRRSACDRVLELEPQKNIKALKNVSINEPYFVGYFPTRPVMPGVLILMLYYIREYPEQVHHPKEDRYLFARLRDRTSEFDDVLAELGSQHAQGEARVRNLEHALTRYELKGESGFLALRALVQEYAEFYLKHRRLEEEVILPAARRPLTKEDWAEIDTVFGANRDPFDGIKLEEDLDKLFSMIVNTIPEAGG
jgi:hemerythrin-like domain-containing protein